MRLNSHIIAMLVEDISDPFFAAVARIIEEQAHQRGYKIFYSSTGNDDAVARDLLKVYRETAAGAYIIAPSAGIGPEITSLRQQGIPVVFFDRYIPGIAVPKVIVDNAQASILAVRHLWENDYRRIGFITLDSEQTQMTQRLEGYLESTSRLRLTALIHRIPFGLAPAVMTHRIGAFLQLEAPDAVIFATNYLAVSGLRAMSALGVNIPDDIAVLGFDDSPYFAFCSPSITAIAQPVQAIAQAILDKLLTGAATNPPETTILPVQLIARQSTVPHSSILNPNQILPK
jgi:LacI family transcriptional regulator